MKETQPIDMANNLYGLYKYPSLEGANSPKIDAFVSGILWA